MRLSALLLVAAGLLAAPEAFADERFDHRGAVGLLLGGGGEYMNGLRSSELSAGFRADADVGGTFAIGVDGNELLLLGRGSFGGPAADWSAVFGYRGYFGQGRLKTFFDLDAAIHATPFVAAGPRVGFGLQVEVTQILGIYAGLAAQVGFGRGIRFDGELVLGVQLRSYLLE